MALKATKEYKITIEWESARSEPTVATFTVRAASWAEAARTLASDPTLLPNELG